MGQSRSEQRDWKKDQDETRNVLDEIQEQAPERDDYEPRYRDVNRDHARGDGDRTRQRHDEEKGIE